jgi:hypothetical protein
MASTAADLLTDELHQQLVGQIAAAADGDWRAAAWLLERGWPDTWRLRPLNGRKPADDSDEALPTATGHEQGDPFAEVDELAAKRQRTTQ